VNFFGLSFPAGRFFGISVRIHVTLLLVLLVWLPEFKKDFVMGLCLISALYLSILLHEFGHALAARWCDGEATQIILWPLGGLAFCRPAFHPTAHLITSAAGPFVSLCLFVFFGVVAMLPVDLDHYVKNTVENLVMFNGVLLVFNMIPAFPMDGGRILRDVLWYFMGVRRATNVAVTLSKLLAGSVLVLGLLKGLGGVWTVFGITLSVGQLMLLAFFIFMQSSTEQLALKWEGPPQYFSIRERWKRGPNAPRPVSPSMVIEYVSYHRCNACGRTEHDSPGLKFYVANDGFEYCEEHRPSA